MKPIFLSLLIVLLSFLPGISQVVLTNINGDDITNDTLSIDAPIENVIKRTNIFFSNTGDEAVDVFVKKIEESIVADTYVTFCWIGTCWTPDVTSVETPIVLQPGETSNEDHFYNEYLYTHQPGTSIVTYEFFDERGSFETVSVTLNLTVAEDETTFTPEISARQEAILREATPNPARGFTWINYDLPLGTQHAQIIIRNLIGQIVLTENLQQGQSRSRIDTSNLNNGIYIYSLVVDNQTINSKRLVVSH